MSKSPGDVSQRSDLQRHGMFFLSVIPLLRAVFALSVLVASSSAFSARATTAVSSAQPTKLAPHTLSAMFATSAQTPTPRWATPPSATENHAFEAINEYLFDHNDTGVREGSRTDGFLVIQNGHVIYERYARGYSATQKHIMWSISKTITALLYGVALKEKKFKLTQSICVFVKMRTKEQCAIRIKDVLEWSTALYWREEYENAGEVAASSVVAMLYGEGVHDMAQFVKNEDMLPGVKPGEVWRYSSGDTILAAHVLAGIYKNQKMKKILQDKLFTPLGITNWSVETDDQNTVGGAYYFYLTLPDLARVGELIMNKGVYNGRQILDSGFITYMSTMPESFKKRRLDQREGTASGAHLWLNDPRDTGLAVPWPKAPRDAVVARGHWGQYLMVAPSLKLIVARVGDTRDNSVNIESVIGLAIDYAKARNPQFNVGIDHIVSTTKATPMGPPDKEYSDGRISLGLRFTAKNFCTCLFVMRYTEAKCRDYASLQQVSPKLEVDYQKKSTTSTLFWVLNKRAQYWPAEDSCRLSK